MELGLYIHIPFCLSKCRYCDFVSYTDCFDMAQRYVFSVLDEARKRNAPRNITSVFIGGGTPTSLTASQLETLLEGIRKIYSIEEDAEFTCECNPGTADNEKLTVLRNYGVNRLSMGLQSTDDGVLERIGRIHTYETFLQGLETAHSCGFDNINADLMYGLPGQTVDMLEKQFKQIAGLGLSHISAYSLILEEGTALYKAVNEGRESLPTEEETADMSDVMIDGLAALGFNRYEISNYARLGKECRHNLLYWNRGDYIGLGVAAHSLCGNIRRENTPSLKEYLNTGDYCQSTVLPEDAAFETVMLALRKTEGLDMEAYISRYGKPDFDGAIQKHIDAGNLEMAGKYLRTTRRGADILNTVLTDFL